MLDRSPEWRKGVAKRELDEKRNCKRCVDYCANGNEGPPACFKWSRIRGHVVTIEVGYSGTRNNAPFCQFFQEKK